MPRAAPRILVCTIGTPGHQRPLRPLVASLVRSGCEVAWATSPDAVVDLADLAGVRAIGVGLEMRVARAAYRERWPEVATLGPQALAAHTFPRLFGGVVAPTMVEPLAALVAGYRPALVIAEPAALAVPIVCAAAGVVHLTHAYGLPLPASHLEGAMHALSARWAALAAPPPPHAGLYRHGYIDIAPTTLSATLEEALPPCPRWPLRPSSGEASATLPERLRLRLAAEQRPVVYATFGTAFNEQAALRATALALARLDALVVVTHGRSEGEHGPCAYPPNVWVEGFIPQAALLPHCDLVVSHGGAGTVLGAASFGIPQLILPRGADQFRNAGAVQAVGAGTTLPADPDDESLLHAARALLASAAAAQSAQALAREIAAMPDADTVANALIDERVAANGRCA